MKKTLLFALLLTLLGCSSGPGSSTPSFAPLPTPKSATPKPSPDKKASPEKKPDERKK